MPHYYAASGAPIQLDESPDDVGVRFGREDGSAVAKKAFRVLAGPAKARRDVPLHLRRGVSDAS